MPFDEWMSFVAPAFFPPLRRTFNLTRGDRVKLVFEANVLNAVKHVWFGTTSSNASGSIGQSF